MTETTVTPKQRLAELRAELTERTNKANQAQLAADTLPAQISRWRAEQTLDGANHSKRIDKATAELTEAQTYLVTWPDVRGELERRIGEIAPLISQDQANAAAARCTALDEQSVELRRAFIAGVRQLRALYAQQTGIEQQRAEQVALVTRHNQQHPRHTVTQPKPFAYDQLRLAHGYLYAQESEVNGYLATFGPLA